MKKLVGKDHPLLHCEVNQCSLEEDHKPLIKHMFEILKYKGGVGLAANQIGVDKRIIIVSIDGFKQAFINPIIILYRGKRRLSQEGCLSINGTYKVLRYNFIIVRGYDENNQPIQRKLKGLAAICVQHEVDHLWGKVIWKK